MTREESIRKILDTVLWTRNASNDNKNILTDALVKALEQESVLDKIRAEINTMPCAITSMREIYINRDKVINIIDKHKAETEKT